MAEEPKKSEIDSQTPDLQDKCLVRTQRFKVPLKEFDDEVRSTLDVDHFLCNATLALDLEVKNGENIFEPEVASEWDFSRRKILKSLIPISSDFFLLQV